MRFEIFLAVSVHHIAIALVLELVLLDAADPTTHSASARQSAAIFGFG